MQNRQFILNGLTYFSDPMQKLQSSGYTLSRIYIDDLRLSPRTRIPKNAFLGPFFDIIWLPIKQVVNGVG